MKRRTADDCTTILRSAGLPESRIPVDHQAHAYASTRGSAPALTTPLVPTTMAPFEPWLQGPVTLSLWPLATSACRVASGMRDSTELSPGYIVCGNGDAGKLRVVQRGASIAC